MRGRVVAITGAAGGIGAALATRFGARGARVALLDRDAAGAAQRARELASAGVEPLALGCDVSCPDRCREALEAVRSRWGGIDVLVNNAGITQLGRVCETDAAVLRRVMDVNFFGAVYCTQAALPSLLERRGALVVLSSVAGFAPLATRAGYCASKHALHGFFESLRAEHRDDGLRVLLVCPSFVDTDIGEHALGPDGERPPRAARTGVRRPMAPERVAEAIVRATLRGRRLLLLPGEARLAYLVSRLAPRLYERAMLRRTRQGAVGG